MEGDAYFGVLIVAGVLKSNGETQKPCGMEKLPENFSVQQCLWKNSRSFLG
jgi:hypothetical protein